ncbi:MULTISPECIES: twin transmembrane helix small protein [Pacificibacter]|uniref:twin transmembrane helix small protein n=1 Tax=Pacificibacter TaxID=1042323 RepID=UPI001C0A65BF|nr:MULTISPECIES: twin transmembrane helix small protein [Pacificibacter]MBU2937376.1 twin transmembrane helix small protein [Pacificibacter marinus]MDO6615372.1 twin transmembrane helix small protein [Pacificibacter sp. 1_MG-2023]
MLQDPLFIAVIVGCVIVSLILARGISLMGRGGMDGAKKSNKMMQYRIGAQLIVVVLVVIYVALRKTGG